MYKAVKINCSSLIPEIVDVDFKIVHSDSLNEDYIHITKGGVTGYESADWKKLIENYQDTSPFASWIACNGTLNRWHRLEIPMMEIIRYLLNNKLITVEKEYGYIKKVNIIDG
jgi:hypothetical protein